MKYYLLEDNSVVTDKDITDRDWFIKDGAIFVEDYVVAKHELCTFKISDIRKESECIYDLIEVGDLIIFYDTGYIVTDVAKRKSDNHMFLELNGDESWSDTTCIAPTAIYKFQKDRKRFICVWEREVE